jgi:hypothetical protein
MLLHEALRLEEGAREPDLVEDVEVDGRRDSPILKRGNFSRSRTSTSSPPRASFVAQVLPPGPPPTTTTSLRLLAIMASEVTIEP